MVCDIYVCVCVCVGLDVRELVPEWFYLPAMFTNTNQVDFGCLQGGHGQRVGDVVLPPWAKDADDFVRYSY